MLPSLVFYDGFIPLAPRAFWEAFLSKPFGSIKKATMKSFSFYNRDERATQRRRPKTSTTGLALFLSSFRLEQVGRSLEQPYVLRLADMSLNKCRCKPQTLSFLVVAVQLCCPRCRKCHLSRPAPQHSCCRCRLFLVLVCCPSCTIRLSSLLILVTYTE